MAWFANFSPCTYFGQEHAGFLRAVGWLERGHEFKTGAVDRLVYRRLQELLQDPWQPAVFLGVHGCELCQYEPGGHGKRNLFLPGTGTVYVSPDLIAHYMNAHCYAPPDEFCAAVMNCPKMSSAAYFKALVLAGARVLVLGWQG